MITKDKAVVIRISPQARQRIKVQALKNRLSIIGFVEELSKMRFDKKVRSIV